jgi:hypothetical protein
MAARRFGLRLAESKSMNAAIRNLGIKAKYALEELKKPFVMFRCSYVPDMSDPDIKRMVAGQALSGAGLLYGQTAPAGAPIEHVIDVTPEKGPSTATAPAEPQRQETGEVPSDATPFSLEEPKVSEAAADPGDTVTPTRVTNIDDDKAEGGKRFFIESVERINFTTTDRDTAITALKAVTAKQALVIEGGLVTIRGVAYIAISNLRTAPAVGDLKL